MPASDKETSAEKRQDNGGAHTLEALLSDLEGKLEAIGGCTDGYCVIRAPISGMHTNGGCRCITRDTHAAQRLALHTLAFRQAAKKLVLELELRAHWPAFCDADPIPDYDGFLDRMERGGLITLRKVTKDDLQQPFAAELGIEKGGSVWVLTNKGRAALSRAGSAQ